MSQDQVSLGWIVGLWQGRRSFFDYAVVGERGGRQ